MHFVKSSSTDTPLHVSDTLFEITLKQHGVLDTIGSKCDKKVGFKFWKRRMERSGIQLEM